MIEFSNNAATLEKQIPLERLFYTETISTFDVSEVKWRMSIKPEFRNVTKYVEGRVRYEEIEVFEVKVNKLPVEGAYHTLLKQIHSKIMYPCVVFFEFRNKYKIAAWKIVDSAAGDNKEILKNFYITAWIYEPTISEKTSRCVNEISNLLLYGEGNIKEIYDRICLSISRCAPKYIGSNAHLSRILFDLCGSKRESINVDVTKRYIAKNPHTRYQKKDNSSAFRYCYEYEDIWYAMINNEKLRTIIQNRKYRDAGDMIYHIDMKYEEMNDSW